MKKYFIMLFTAAMMLLIIPVSAFADSSSSPNLVPAMTSNTTPSGIVSASSFWLTNSERRDPFHAFDRLDASYGWTTDYKSNTGWIAYQFETPTVVNAYTLTRRLQASFDDALKDWTFEGWDGAQWVILDQQQGITGWEKGEKKKFYFPNETSYIKYRLNVTKTNGSSTVTVKAMEMMYISNDQRPPEKPLNLTATAGASQVALTWNEAKGATGYNIKRSTSSGGPFTSVATSVYGTSYTDTTVTNEITYYYVVSAVNAYGESSDSKVVFATPKDQKALLTITMTTGLQKEYDLSMTEVSAFIAWLDSRSTGTGPAKFMFDKGAYNKGPFISRKDYVIFDKIITFEVSEYRGNKG